MTDGDNNGITTRVRVLEIRTDDIRSDLLDIKKEVRGLRNDITTEQRGLTTTEKIALLGSSSAVIASIVGAIALLGGH